MAKVVCSFTSAFPNCIVPRVMGLVYTRPITTWRIQQGLAAMQDDTTIAMVSINIYNMNMHNFKLPFNSVCSIANGWMIL